MALIRTSARVAAAAIVRLEHSRAAEMSRNLAARSSARLLPSGFYYGKYPHTFLERKPPDAVDDDGDVPNVIWSFWIGDNPLTPARRAALKSMREMNPETPVELIGLDRLGEFVLNDHPLHPAFEFLSLNHRSDYLRAYFLYHFGGGYSDIKGLVSPWADALTTLRRSGGKWMAGTALTGAKWAGNPPGRLGRHVSRYFEEILSGTTLGGRARNPLCAEWLREIERVLDYAQPALEESPGKIWGADSSYPLEWMALQGNILQPLCLKYGERLIIDPAFAWDETRPYR